MMQSKSTTDPRHGYGLVITTSGNTYEGSILLDGGYVHIDGRLRLLRLVDGVQMETYRARTQLTILRRKIRRITWMHEPQTRYLHAAVEAEARGAEIVEAA